MLNYHSSIKESKSYSGLTVKEISPLMKLNLRGKSREFLSTIGKNMMGKNLFIPMEDRNINVTVTDPVFLDKDNKRLNA